jgi:hypothetical protein
MITLHCKCAVVGDEDELHGEVGGSAELRLVRLKALTRHELGDPTRVPV